MLRIVGNHQKLEEARKVSSSEPLRGNIAKALV
jgi:hypothetical protein